MVLAVRDIVLRVGIKALHYDLKTSAGCVSRRMSCIHMGTPVDP